MHNGKARTVIFGSLLQLWSSCSRPGRPRRRKTNASRSSSAWAPASLQPPQSRAGRQGHRRGAARSRLRGLGALQSDPRRSARRAGSVQARGRGRRGGAGLLCRPWHGGRGQERDRAHRHGDRMREQDRAPLGRARPAVRCGERGAPADRAARRLPQQSFSAMPEPGRQFSQRLSRLLASDRRGSRAADRQRHAVGPARGRRRRGRPFALRQVAAQEFRGASPPLYARRARADGARGPRRLARRPGSGRSRRVAAHPGSASMPRGAGKGHPA